MSASFTRRSLLSLLGIAPALRAQPSRPNVLFIAVDDLNDWIGPLNGYPGVRTPNLDRLATRGLTFTRAYCAAPVCNPSRSSIITGLAPSTTGVYGNGQWWRPVVPDAVTLPEHFRLNGYLTAACGKIYHHTLGFDEPRAWDEFQEQLPDPVPRTYPMHGMSGASLNFDWGPAGIPEEQMADAKVASWTERFLSRDHQRPFFAAAGIFKPHLRWYVPQRYLVMYPLEKIQVPKAPADDLDDIPPEGRKLARGRGDYAVAESHQRHRHAIQAYLACITFADAQIGRILTALDRSPNQRNTIVVVWSDHGWHLGEKRHYHKSTLWERATRVPLIFAGPGIPSGRVCERTVSLLDLYPTLSETCGLPRANKLDGVSFRKLLRDPGTKWDRPAVSTMGRGNHSVRSERWRYIRYQDGSEELYDHRSDPNEWRNLATEAQYALIMKSHRIWLPKIEREPTPAKSGYPQPVRVQIEQQSRQRIDAHTGLPYPVTKQETTRQ